MKWTVWAPVAAATVAVGVALYLRRRSVTQAHPAPVPTITVRVPVLGLVFNDAEFSQWQQTNYHVWSEVYDDEAVDVSPSVIVEYTNTDRDPLHEPQFNIVVEEQTTPCTAQEYVERQQMPQSTVDVAIPSLKDFTPAASSGSIDIATCAFGELEQRVMRRVINVILVSGSMVVVLQLITRSDDANRYVPMFTRLCVSAIKQLDDPVQSDIARRRQTNQVWFQFPSTRPKVSGYAINLSSRRGQLASLSHPYCQMVAEMFQSYGGEVRAAFLERDDAEGSATFSIQFQSVHSFKEACEGLKQYSEESGMFFNALERFLCITAVRAVNAEVANRQLSNVIVKKFERSKPTMEYRHAPSGISYSIVLDHAVDAPVYMLHSFGPFDVQWHTHSRDRSVMFQMAVRSLKETGSTFIELQRLVMQRYEEGQLTRYPSVDRWCRFDAQVVTADGLSLTEHVAILEHEGYLVHVVWTYPKGRMTHSLFVDRVRRELVLPRWGE